MIKVSKLQKSAVIGALSIMVAALLWSLDGVFIRPKFYEFPAALIVFLEHFLGFIVLSPFIILGWKQIKLLRRKDWVAIFWVSIFGGLIGTILITKAFFAAVHGEITFATVVILQKLQPVFALLLARIVLKEKLSRKFYVWSVLAILAAYVLAFGKTGLHFSEIDWLHSAAFFAVLAAFSFGSSTVLGKRIVNHLDFKATTALRFGITSLLAFILIIANKDLWSISELGGIYWIYLLIIVFTSGAAAMFIYYFGLKRITASAATICELFWPLSAVILDYILNKNTLNSVEIIAGLILLLAFYQVVRQGQIKNFQFEARHIKGEGRGERLGFPTINLNKIDLDIPHGVYLIEFDLDNKRDRALLHFGRKETFSEEPSLELLVIEHLDDYPEIFKIKIIKKIREVKKFDSAEDLSDQLAQDREYLLKNF